MGHLNELHDTYNAKGLTVMATSNEPSSRVQDFVEKYEAKYPVMVEESDTGSKYGVTSIPRAVLIGADGRVLFYDHPNKLSTAQIEKYLESVRMLPDFPKSLSSIGKAITKEKFAAARKKAEKAIEKSADDEATKKIAEQARDWIDWYGETALKNAESMLNDKDPYGAYLAYDELADTFKGLPAGSTADDAAKAIKGDKTHKDELTSGKKWDKLRDKFEDFGDKKDKKARAALDAFIKKYSSTAAGKKARGARQHLYN